ncbi:MAG: hypothetical protein FJ278_06825, partial [Planctomycetes bacterium]|nr:hypothetical protein [Planctomycetota bacterium]
MAQAVRGAQFGLTLSWLFACALRAASEQTPIPEGAPFHLAADVATGSALDVSFLLQRPAGAQGRVRAQGERFVFGDGTPARFWGVNLCADALYPPKGEAAAIAKRLAMSGCNLVRIGYWDGGTGGVFRQDLDNTSTIDPERLDRLDYFFAQLKDAGVYSLLVLSMGRRSLKSGDVGGVFDAEAAPAAYQIGRFFDPRTRQADETVWRSLLGHGNPYTGLRWADDLAIMGIEILNESSLYYAYRLFTGLPEALTAKVQQQWNQWLVKRYPNREELVRHWGSENIRPDEDPNGGTVALDFSLLRDPLWRDNPSSLPREGRGNDWNRFLAEVCRDYYLTEIRFLRELGVQQPVACNGGGSLVAADVWSNRVGDFFTQHSYHDHPNWDGPMYYSNASALKSGLLPIPGLSLRRLAAMPYGASEYDFCFPNDWRAEGGPAVAAYAAFQGWSLATRFAYWSHPWEGREAMYSSTSGIRSIWRIHNDPAAFGQWPLTALIFLRGDVREALKTVDIGFSETDTFYRERHRFPPAHLRFLDSVPFVHKTRWTHFDQVYKGDADLVVSSGRSTSGDYSHAQAAILASANLWGDPYGLQEGAFKAPKRATARSPDEVAKRENGFREAVQQLPG